MLDLAPAPTREWAHVDRPLPSGLIRRTAERLAGDCHELEPTLFEFADLIRLLEPFEDGFDRGRVS